MFWKNHVCKDQLNPILISTNLSIKTPLIGEMKFNSHIFKTKIPFKTFFFQICMPNKIGCMNFGKLNFHNLTMSNMNFKNLELTFLESYIDKHFEIKIRQNEPLKCLQS